jgi:protein SCO1/2
MRFALLALVLAVTPAWAALTPAELSRVGSKPPAGAVLPAGLGFIDERGAPYVLADDALPTVLLFADYSCKHICGPGITLTAGALNDAGLVPGRDYRMVVIGLDGDGPVVARHLVAERLQSLPREGQAMTLLTGTPATVAAAEKALGYHAEYDAQADQFAHDAAIYIFAPSGALSALLPETASTAPQIAAAVAGAKADAPYVAPAAKSDDSFAGRISAICYGFAAEHGAYAKPAILALRLGGVAIVAAFAGFLLWSLRRQRRAA